MNLLPFRDLFPRLKIPAHELQRIHTEFSSNVQAFQERWNKLFPEDAIMPANGIYDLNCKNRVEAWQYRLFGMGDGFVGPETARALNIKLIGDSDALFLFR